LENKPEYVTFALFFIMFGLAVIAASLNLMVLKFMTMNTEDEKRDVQEAIQVAQIGKYDAWTRSLTTHRITGLIETLSIKCSYADCRD
jgi:hypothetical protein